MNQTPKGKPSFFDPSDVTVFHHIWEKPKLSPKDVILDVYAEKQSRKNESLKSIHLLLTQETIFITKNNLVHGQLQLVLARMEIIHEPKMGFRLTKNCQTLDFFISDPTEFKKWHIQLASKCLMSNFHEEYQVQKMIGKGSFAKVYLAYKREGNVEYAVKAFNKEFMLEQFKGKESLINEIKVMRRFNQQSLVHLYEVYETVNSIYFVIDILRGGELLQRVKQKGMLHQNDLQKLMYNFTKALAYIHSKNCVHRDLKPENLLLNDKDSDSDVVIADFGLATFLDEEIIFKRCGTPGFVAPEILNYKDGDKFYDQKCDVFSAGIIFYVLLTGKQPFQGADYKLILRANKSCEINFNLPQINNSPKPLQDLLRKMLIADPIRRPSSADCLLHEYYSKIAAGESIPAFQNTQENLIMYEKDYLYGLSKKTQEYFIKFYGSISSQDFVGSMELQHRTPALNGKIDTIGSLSNYSTSIPRLAETSQKVGASKFSQFSQSQKIITSIPQHAQGSDSPSPSNRHHKQQEDLHKKALKNSLFSKHQEESKKGEDDCVNDENPGLHQAMTTINSNEGQIKLFKQIQSPVTSPGHKKKP